MNKTLTVRRLFLIDGLGAAVTAVTLGVVLPAFGPAFAMPERTTVALALVAASFAAYSLTCHARAADARFLLGIAVANTAYCAVTAWLLVTLRGSLTWLDVAYFVGEILVIATLVTVEVTVALRADADRVATFERADDEQLR